MFNDMKQKKLSDLNLLVHFDKKNFINQVNFFSHYIKFAILFSFFFYFTRDLLLDINKMHLQYI